MIISVIVSAGSESVVEASSVIVAVTVKTSVTTAGAGEEVGEIGDEVNVVEGMVCSADEIKASEDMEVEEVEIGDAITIAVSMTFVSEVTMSVTKTTSVGRGTLSAESRGTVRTNSAESNNTISTVALRVSIERYRQMNSQSKGRTVAFAFRGGWFTPSVYNSRLTADVFVVSIDLKQARRSLVKIGMSASIRP